MTFKYISSAQLPTPYATFTLHGFQDEQTGKEHLALTLGELNQQENVLGRIHSECLTGDALFSLRCDCGFQLEAAMKRIAEEGQGVIFYLRQEGRGIGLINKIRAYELQDAGCDTVEANEKLGFAADMRSYEMLATMVKHLGIKSLRLMTNNPRKLAALQGLGIELVERVPLTEGLNQHNADYLSTKSEKLGHLMKEADYQKIDK